MKTLLALLLAAVLAVSLICVVNAADFSDAAEIDVKNVEPVTVLSKLGIIAGFEDGTFQPDGTLTRAQAAKIIAYMKLGKDGAEALTATEQKFSDVPTSHWSCKYVNYCAEQGIVSGTGSSKFNPNGKLTGFQFGKMILVATGFNADQEGLNGADWDKNVNKLVKETLLNRGVNVSSKELKRQDACHLALNGLFYGEEEDPEGTLAGKTNGVTRSFGSYDKEDLHRPVMLYTSEQENAYWDGTELAVKASPFLIYNTAFTCGQLYNDLGNQEFDIDHVDGWRNGTHFNPTTFTTFPASGSPTEFVGSGDGITTEWYYASDTKIYMHILYAWRAFEILAVTEATVASDGTVLEPGSITVRAPENRLTVETNDFTETDVGTYALCIAGGGKSWRDAYAIYGVKRANIVSGELQSNSKSVKVGGKGYPTLFKTMAISQNTSPYPEDYIAKGGAVGDIVSIALDENDVCHALWQPK